MNQALQNSGIDLSQASVSVQINLGKRAIKRPAPDANCTPKVDFGSYQLNYRCLSHISI
jgi:hypothetical protein